MKKKKNLIESLCRTPYGKISYGVVYINSYITVIRVYFGIDFAFRPCSGGKVNGAYFLSVDQKVNVP